MTLEQQVQELKFELDRTKAVLDCQNLMGKYVIRLMSGDFIGCADLWARRDDSRVEMAWGVYDGFEGVKNCYEKHHAVTLGDMVGTLPVHTLTTPVVEVAKDGKTARAVWISPGVESHANEETGQADCNWCWIRYGTDFICEDGKWYIWHMSTYGLFMCNYYKSWGDTAAEKKQRDPFAILEHAPADALPNRKPVHEDWTYSVDSRMDPQPVPPEAYDSWKDEWYGY